MNGKKDTYFFEHVSNILDLLCDSNLLLLTLKLFIKFALLVHHIKCFKAPIKGTVLLEKCLFPNI